MGGAAWALLVGLVAGVLSGLFGIGGGIVATPAIRLLLARPELIAVGTPLPVIFPGAAAGAVAYARRGLADVKAGVTIGIAGAPFTVLGALGVRAVGGKAVLVATALLIAYMAVEMARGEDGGADAGASRGGGDPAAPGRDGRRLGYILLGAGAGLYSGLLGLGGGFVIVPVLATRMGFAAKRAMGTSLVAVSVLVVPASVAHWALGHVEPALAAQLALGVVPGALVGARLTAVARDRVVRVAFALLLGVVAVVLALTELGVIGRV